MVETNTIRGEIGWSTFEERILKNIQNYNVRLQNVVYSRWASPLALGEFIL